jgi:hypothetical protein
MVLSLHRTCTHHLNNTYTAIDGTRLSDNATAPFKGESPQGPGSARTRHRFGDQVRVSGDLLAGDLLAARPRAAMLSRWPHLTQLAAARRATLTAVVAEHTRDVPDVPARAEAIRDAAGAWARFWTGRLDLDELAWAVSELPVRWINLSTPSVP